MEWTPSEKMTFTDLRAILASWDVPSISNDKAVLIKEVAWHYRAIMLARANRRSVVPSFVSGLPSFTQGDDKSIGTDCPLTERSYIGSDETTRDEEEVAASNPLSGLDHSLIRDFEAALATCAAAYNKQREQADRAAPSDDQETHQVDDAGNVIGKKNEIPDETPVESAACAAAPPPPPPSLRRAVQLEKEATAKAKAAKDKMKDKVKDKKNKNTIYGYLPMAGAFIDEDQKKGDDPDQHDIIV